jgi:hypothetical protein
MDVQNPFLPALVLTAFGRPDFRCLKHREQLGRQGEASMIFMLPRPCITDWSGHSSLIVVTGAVGIPCGAVSWRLPEL